MLLRRPAAGMLAAMSLTVTACGSTSHARAPRAVTAQPGYPVRVDDCGESFTYTRAPRRVVVMNGGSVAEVSSLLALGLGDRIVANAQSYGASEVPGRAERIARLPTGGVTLNDQGDIPREAMLALRPDLVLATYAGGFRSEYGFATRRELRAMGAGSYVPARACGAVGEVTGRPVIEDSHAMLQDLGTIFNVRKRADDLIAASRQRISRVAATVGGRPARRVLVIFAGMKMGSNEFSSVGANGIWNDILARSGAVNAFAGSTDRMFADLSKEALASASVDAVVIVRYRVPHPEAEAARLFAEFPQWEAARARRYVVLSDSVYLGPSNAEAVERIARLVHPEAF